MRDNTNKCLSSPAVGVGTTFQDFRNTMCNTNGKGEAVVAVKLDHVSHFFIKFIHYLVQEMYGYKLGKFEKERSSQ